MFKYLVVFKILFLSFLLIPTAFAVEVKDLYVAKVEISSQHKSDRNKALKKALSSVLVKIGGNQHVLANKEIRRHLNKYNSYVTNFRYEYEQGKQFLKASFDAAKINQLFVDANLPIWGSLRPQVVLWLVNEQGLVRELISDGSASFLSDVSDEVSTLRGLPIALPLWDLSDTAQLTISDVWGRFASPVYFASQRYLAEAIVIVRLSDNSLVSDDLINNSEACTLLCQQSITLDWSIYSADNVDETPKFSEQYTGIDRSKLLADALHDIADEIYQKYALTTIENNSFEIEVANVATLTRYVQVTEFLQALSAVQSVKLVSAEGQKRRFSLTLLGSKQALLASLKLNNTLKQYIDPLDPEFDKKIPLFYWEKT